MTGRAIDQLPPHPGDPTLRESFVTDARSYIALAEQTNGPIPAPIDFAWPWGEALTSSTSSRLMSGAQSETSITAGSEFAPGKAVHYRMHPDNIGCLADPAGCLRTGQQSHPRLRLSGADRHLRTLEDIGIQSAGAGLDAERAERPAVVGHVVVASCGMGSSGVPHAWAATGRRPGVAYVADLTDRSANTLAERVLAVKGAGDVAVVSVHWGSNWGYDVDNAQIQFAHRLIDAGIDVVHGHSSHHPRPIEVYRGRLIMYGCGDTIDDYEGIATYEAFRHDLRLLYFASINDQSGAALRMVPMRMRRMRLERAPDADAE